MLKILDVMPFFFQVFLEADEDLKGYLNTEDLKVAMVSLFGYKPSKVIY